MPSSSDCPIASSPCRPSSLGWSACRMRRAGTRPAGARPGTGTPPTPLSRRQGPPEARPMAHNGSGQRSTLRAVAFNSGWQLVTFAARAASGLLVTVLLARTGGASALGTFQFALNFTLLFGFIVGFGLPNLLAREV